LSYLGWGGQAYRHVDLFVFQVDEKGPPGSRVSAVDAQLRQLELKAKLEQQKLELEHRERERDERLEQQKF
jgi:hypothetical protein